MYSVNRSACSHPNVINVNNTKKLTAVCAVALCVGVYNARVQEASWDMIFVP
jgi:hypothetical protein